MSSVTAGAIGIYCGVLQLLGNVHVVVEKQYYRSAQLDKAALERSEPVMRNLGTRTKLQFLGSSESSITTMELARANL